MTNKTIRINKVLRELNVSLERAINFLKENGFIIVSNPSVKISEEEYLLLKNQFTLKTDVKKPENNDDLNYKIEIKNGNNQLLFNEKKIVKEDETTSFLSNKIFSNLKSINDKNEKLKSFGHKYNYFGFTLHRNCILKVSIGNETFIENLEFSFKKILELEGKIEGFGLEYLSKLISKSVNQNDISEEIPNQENFIKENPFQDDVTTVLENNYANGKIIKILHFNNQTLESQFTDFQAFHICKGLKNQSYLHNKYVNHKQTEEDTYLAHNLATKLLNEKGRKMVDYILTLPSLPFHAEQFKILFSTLDKIRIEGKNENPIIRLTIPNEEGINEELEFSFYAIDGKKYVNQIIAKNKTKKSITFSVTRNGLVLPNNKNLNVTPVLQFFYQASKSKNNFNDAIISYGITSGKCSVCGRTLNDEKSKLKGIGPVCEKYF